MALAKDAAMAVREVVRDALDRAGRGSQRKFASDVGVRAQTVSKWLAGENDIPQWRWLEVEDALGLDPLTLARAAGLELDIPADDVARRWAQLFPPPPTELQRHLEAVALAMEEGRPIPRRAEVPRERQLGDLRDQIDDLRERITRIQRLLEQMADEEEAPVPTLPADS